MANKLKLKLKFLRAYDSAHDAAHDSDFRFSLVIKSLTTPTPSLVKTSLRPARASFFFWLLFHALIFGGGKRQPGSLTSHCLGKGNQTRLERAAEIELKRQPEKSLRSQATASKVCQENRRLFKEFCFFILVFDR